MFRNSDGLSAYIVVLLIVCIVMANTGTSFTDDISKCTQTTDDGSRVSETGRADMVAGECPGQGPCRDADAVDPCAESQFTMDQSPGQHKDSSFEPRIEEDTTVNNDDDIQPSLIPSLFSNVPPTINFVRPDQKVKQFPSAIKNRLKYVEGMNGIVESYVVRSGFSVTSDTNNYILHFGIPFQPQDTQLNKHIRPQSKFNHIPASWHLGCKNMLAWGLVRQQRKYGEEEYGFFPKTYQFPHDKQAFKRAWDATPAGEMWIIKPACMSGGRGVSILTDLKEVPNDGVAQRYLLNPLLIDGAKMDLRIYVLVGSIDPLRVYIFPEGEVRIAMEKYSMDNFDRSDVHLTNFAVNKLNAEFTQDKLFDIRRTLTWFWHHLKEHYGAERQPIWDKIKDIVIKSILSGEEFMQAGTNSYVKNRHSVFELFGYDIFIDDNLKPWLMEINVSPKISNNTLKEVRGPMLADILNMAGVQIPDDDGDKSQGNSEETVPKHLVTDPRLWTQPLTDEEKQKQEKFTAMKDESQQQALLDELTPDDVRILINSFDENNRKGLFESIYPTPDTKKYHKFFKEPRYYNLLLCHWMQRYHLKEEEGIQVLESYCQQKKHLKP
ncbi:tubulin polyglutamylase TTLL4-like [Lingula anatina]|uniref:Tubulin polyglutamylase TTLL4-like n=1 Tax=Lingula anatina TaxID=7574 RepID=A0A1S3HEW9_LINAN|nr:tubulin polyglutamylase TTLL4-like [Lingula anatina]|eukprot:XP_013384622.1 tubulin polyglutamylase TTLL4-like [Lingula anatina]